MTATLAQRETIRMVDRLSYTAEDRANALRSIAEHWDSQISFLAKKYPTLLTEDDITEGMYRAIAEYADPGLTIEQIRRYTDDLLEACRALTRYELGDGWDGDEDDEKYRYSTETVVGILNTDIDYTLFPLVHGVDENNACRRCERLKKGAAFWNVREPGSAYCAACKDA